MYIYIYIYTYNIYIYVYIYICINNLAFQKALCYLFLKIFVGYPSKNILPLPRSPGKNLAVFMINPTGCIPQHVWSANLLFVVFG